MKRTFHHIGDHLFLNISGLMMISNPTKTTNTQTSEARKIGLSAYLCLLILCWKGKYKSSVCIFSTYNSFAFTTENVVCVVIIMLSYELKTFPEAMFEYKWFQIVSKKMSRFDGFGIRLAVLKDSHVVGFIIGTLLSVSLCVFSVYF